MGYYAKGIVAALTAGLVALQTALSDNTVTAPEWVTIAIALLGALGVVLIPNAAAPDTAGRRELG